MTIGIGFHCRDGVLLVADQQQTVQGYFKTHSKKIDGLSYGGATILWTFAHLPNLVTVMKSGVFAKLPQFPPTLTVGDITGAIHDQIQEMREKYPAEMERQEFLLACGDGSQTRLVRVAGGIVDEPEWSCIGGGDSSLVNFIYKTFNFGPPIISHVDEALPLALYMVFKAKQFVDGVGGPTDAAIMRLDRNAPEFILPNKIEWFEKRFERAEVYSRDLFNILTSISISEENLERSIKELAHGIRYATKQR